MSKGRQEKTSAWLIVVVLIAGVFAAYIIAKDYLPCEYFIRVADLPPRCVMDYSTGHLYGGGDE